MNGVADGDKLSTINLNNYNGFTNGAVTLSNIKLTGNSNLITTTGETIKLKENVYLDGNISATSSAAMEIYGTDTSTITLNGKINTANSNDTFTTTLFNGNLKFNTDTFETSTLKTESGNINFVDKTINNYNIAQLNSNASTKYSIDLDITNEVADKLIVGNSSSGTVFIEAINFINPEIPDKEFTAQIISGSGVQLALSEELKNIEYGYGITSDIKSNITSSVNFDDTFQEYTTEGKLFGKLELATTENENDSVSLTCNRIEWGETITTDINDTLSALNKMETEEERNFNFNSSEDIYTVKEDLGITSSGVVNINGVNGSTINGNGNDMFVLDNETILNLNNVTITNANSVVSGTNENSILNIINSTIANNTYGISTAGSINISGNSTVNDTITATRENQTLTIKDGNINLGGKITGYDIAVENASLTLKTEDLLNNLNMNISGENTYLNFVNGTTNTIEFNSLSIQDNINIAVDVDLANASMDTIFANSYTFANGNKTINISNMNMLSDTNQIRTEIPFADANLKANITTSIKEVSYSPIWKYLVEYLPESGSFVFLKGGGYSPSSWESFNPATLVGPVAAQMGGYLVQLNSYEEAFRNMDMYMLMTNEQRQALKYANKYAASDSNLVFSPTSTPYTNEAGWFRPYATFEKVGLKNGPKVNNVAWGSFAGLESQMYELGNGWDGIYSVHASYNGSHQTFKGNSIYQNGANLGLVGMAYKDNFFTGLTINVGSSVGDADTKYGSEDFAMLMTGVASKSGYNYEFNNGKFIIQPNFIMSYTMVNTFDYTSASGVRINADPLHALQLEPGIKLIGNLENGWQPYAGVSAVMNIMDKTHFKANDVSLPEMSVKPYAKYGVGVRKTWGQKFTGFLQAFVTSDGRNGVGLQFGFRWKLGKNVEKSSEPTVKKYIKAGSKQNPIS